MASIFADFGADVRLYFYGANSVHVAGLAPRCSQ